MSDDRAAGEEEHVSSETQMLWVAGEHRQERSPALLGAAGRWGLHSGL